MQDPTPRTHDAAAAAKPKNRRRWLAGLLAGGALTTLLAGGWSLHASAHSGPGGGHRHGGFSEGMARDPQATMERAEFMADWALSRIDASDEQRDKVKSVLREAMADLQPLAEAHRGARQAMVDALSQPTVDRAVLESLRQAELKRAEQASQRIVQAMADAADVLTPEQRAKLTELAQRHRHH